MHKLLSQSLLLTSLLLITGIAQAATAPFYACEKAFSPALQVKPVKYCGTGHIGNLPSPKTLGKQAFNNALYHALQHSNNLGGIKVLFPGQHPKVVFRSAYLSSAPLCIHSLAKRGVTSVINLYSGQLGYASHLLPLEEAIYHTNGIHHYTHIEHYMVNQGKLGETLHLDVHQLNEKIASIVRLIAAAKGNVMIHCYAGQHDTGVIFGVLNKCYNKQSIKAIQQDTRCHIGTDSHYQQHSIVHAMEIIKQFPCKQLMIK